MLIILLNSVNIIWCLTKFLTDFTQEILIFRLHVYNNENDIFILYFEDCVVCCYIKEDEWEKWKNEKDKKDEENEQ
jgi:hypothetical protein